MGKSGKTGMLDKNGRLFGRLSVIDFAVIVLIIGLVFAITYRFTSSAMTKDVNCRIRYTLSIEGVRDFTIEYYQEGLSCYDKNKQEYIGDIVSVSSKPFTVYETQYDGSLTAAQKPGVSHVYIEIEADARETSSAYLLNGAYELKVGSQINLNTRYIDVWAVVISAEIIK